MRQLSELLAQVKDEQGYIVVRERTHRNTAESTNARVKWWSLFQLGRAGWGGVLSGKHIHTVRGRDGGGESADDHFWV